MHLDMSPIECADTVCEVFFILIIVCDSRGEGGISGRKFDDVSIEYDYCQENLVEIPAKELC
jgi:hypothetical protein